MKDILQEINTDIDDNDEFDNKTTNNLNKDPKNYQ